MLGKLLLGLSLFLLFPSFGISSNNSSTIQIVGTVFDPGDTSDLFLVSDDSGADAPPILEPGERYEQDVFVGSITEGVDKTGSQTRRNWEVIVSTSNNFKLKNVNSSVSIPYKVFITWEEQVNTNPHPQHPGVYPQGDAVFTTNNPSTNILDKRDGQNEVVDIQEIERSVYVRDIDLTEIMPAAETYSDTIQFTIRWEQ